MNRAAVQHGKPLVDSAMYDLEAQITTIIPGKSPCLACLYPQKPDAWKREFPVFGAVSGTVACMGAMEIVKILAGFGATLAGQMLMCDLRTMTFQKVKTQRSATCEVCGNISVGV